MLYSPKIDDDLIRRLYQLKQKEKKPMTKLVNEGITEYLERKENGKQENDSNRNETNRINN